MMMAVVSYFQSENVALIYFALIYSGYMLIIARVSTAY